MQIIPVINCPDIDCVKTKIDVLGFDYEMGLDFQEYKSQGIDIAFRIIPREVFDKKAVEKGQVKFYDVAFIEVKPTVKGKNMNPVDHPHGGGEGHSPIGLKSGPKTKWGKIAMGVKTRKPGKWSDKFILARRKGKKL